MKETSYCRYCNLYGSHHPAALGKHEKYCWANPKADGSKNTDFSCIACGERLTTKKNLATHRREQHTQIKQQECRHCWREWNTTDIRRAIHEKRCHQNPGTSHIYPCAHCKRRFDSQGAMKEHSKACKGKTAAQESIAPFPTAETSSEKNLGVYSITAPSGKIYIGMTARMGFKERWKEHIKKLRRGNHHCRGLQSAYIKYGEEELTFKVLEEYYPRRADELVSLERHILMREREIWDEYHDSGGALYNARPTGTGSVRHSEESNEKRRIAYYLANNSSCPIWNRICPACGKQYTARKKSQGTCIGDSCVKNVPRRLTPVKKPPLRHCGGESCSNFVLPGSKYCGVSCSYAPCQSPICYNYTFRDGHSRGYCNKMCRERRGELNPTVLQEMHHSRGMSTHDIGKLLGCSAVAVQLCMKKYGIERLTLSEQCERRRETAAPSRDELWNRYVEQGLSVKALAKEYKVGARMMSSWLHQSNIPVRRRVKEK